MFTEDELRQARAVPVLEIAEQHGARLKKSGNEHEGPCLVCGGVDRFWVVPSLNVWHLPRMRRPRRRHRPRETSQRQFVCRGREGPDRQRRRNAVATRSDARGDRGEAGERSNAAGRGRRSGAQGNERGANRRLPAAGRRHARRNLPARRPQDRREPLGDQARARGRRHARLVRTRPFQQDDPKKPFHEFNGQFSAPSSRS